MYVKVHYDTPSFFLQTSPQAKAPINITAAILPEKRISDIMKKTGGFCLKSGLFTHEKWPTFDA